MQQHHDVEPDGAAQAASSDEYYDSDESSEEEVEGVPWYLFDSQAHA